MLKIGLAAPFEGRYRDIGYEVIYAVRLAVREANAAGGVGGYSLGLVALDDGGDPELAARQALKLAVDPDVLAVIGHWRDDTTRAAATVYAQHHLPLLATTSDADLPAGAFRMWPVAAAEQAAVPPGARQCPPPCDNLEDLGWLAATHRQFPAEPVYGPALWGQPQFLRLAGEAGAGAYFIAPAPYPAQSGDPGFSGRYTAISGGVAPYANAVLAYDAARLILAALAEGLAAGPPSRGGLEAALATVRFDGLSGPIRFSVERDWEGAAGWVYQWRDGTPEPIEVAPH
jgi:ABC-type branched-subunit amino acid transport system substrate-binding protein